MKEQMQALEELQVNSYHLYIYIYIYKSIYLASDVHASHVRVYTSFPHIYVKAKIKADAEAKAAQDRALESEREKKERERENQVKDEAMRQQMIDLQTLQVTHPTLPLNHPISPPWPLEHPLLFPYAYSIYMYVYICVGGDRPSCRWRRMPDASKISRERERGTV